MPIKPSSSTPKPPAKVNLRQLLENFCDEVEAEDISTPVATSTSTKGQS